MECPHLVAIRVNHNRNRLLTLLVGLLLYLLVAGCNGQPVPESPQPTGYRIVSLAPAAAEMLEVLGRLDDMVGIGEFGPWPEGIEQLPVVGGYSSPNVEQVLTLDVDLLITAESQAGSPAHRRLEQLGVQVLALDTSTYEGIFESLIRLGEVLGLQTEAAAVVSDLQSALEAIEQRSAGLDKRSVLFVVGRDPLYIAGPGSHIDKMIALAGGQNVAHDAFSPYQQYSIETILERLPVVIIDTSDNRPGSPRGALAGSWDRWQFLPAVSASQVHHVDPAQLVIPGIRLPEMTERMGRFIHPEVFGNPTPADYGQPEIQDTEGDDGAAS
jgi:ABC-type Fe3+-hydroxamate transport system substrate-binding protein